MRRIICISLFLLVLSAGLAGFGAWNLLHFRVGSFELAAFQQSDSERLEDLRSMIEQETGVPAASEASQCKLIAVGSKPCGGPWGYLVYSTAKTNESKLEQLVSEFNQRQKKFYEERRLLSDCSVVPKPEVEFTDGVCKIKRN